MLELKIISGGDGVKEQISDVVMFPGDDEWLEVEVIDGMINWLMHC